MKKQTEIKKIAMYDLEGHLLEIFEVETYVELEKQLKLPYGSISRCVSNNQHQVDNRQFRECKLHRYVFKKIGDVSSLADGRREYKTILKLYNDKVICAYESLDEALRKNNLKSSTVSMCLRGNYKTAGGFQWKYADDTEDDDISA